MGKILKWDLLRCLFCLIAVSSIYVNLRTKCRQKFDLVKLGISRYSEVLLLPKSDNLKHPKILRFFVLKWTLLMWGEILIWKVSESHLVNDQNIWLAKLSKLYVLNELYFKKFHKMAAKIVWIVCIVGIKTFFIKIIIFHGTKSNQANIQTWLIVHNQK